MANLPEDYRLRLGKPSDRYLLINFLTRSYQELQEKLKEIWQGENVPESDEWDYDILVVPSFSIDQRVAQMSYTISCHFHRYLH